jgi:hypothetical protein
MNILGLRVFTKKGFHRRVREAERSGHRFALAEFVGANEVHYATPIVARNETHGKIVILGDNLIVARNTFIREQDEVSLEVH